MSEAAEKVESLRHIPIFPLPLVLLPGELLPLHIFEPRYRQMLADVSAERNVFGVSLFEQGESLVDRPDVGSVGCVAEVREVQPLPDERSNIRTLGLIRYRILEFIDLDKPYLTAAVEFFEDVAEDEETLESTADEIFGLFERVARAAFDLSGSRGPFPELQRSDPERLSFVVAAAFNFENGPKYDLLELESTIERFGKLRTILESAVDRMEKSAAVQKTARHNGHSNSKIDL
ncbi:MAG: LON peptidase substrate-binding domain-containing protein [Pyrinomonadaceae bacterium]